MTLEDNYVTVYVSARIRSENVKGTEERHILHCVCFRIQDINMSNIKKWSCSHG